MDENEVFEDGIFDDDEEFEDSDLGLGSDEDEYFGEESSELDDVEVQEDEYEDEEDEMYQDESDGIDDEDEYDYEYGVTQSAEKETGNGQVVGYEKMAGPKSEGAEISDNDADIDAEIAKLQREIDEASGSDEDMSLDAQLRQLEDEIKDGNLAELNSSRSSSIAERDELFDEDDAADFNVAAKENKFISSSGEIVVMNPSDSEDSFRLEYVDISKIITSKRIRLNVNVEDIVRSIKSTGLLKPIDVAPAQAEGLFVLLDGYRRVLACAKAGKRRIPCVVNTRVSIPEVPILEAMYNHSKKYSVKEIVEYIDYLEKQKGIMSASMIEYLLQLNSGDYTKLKDIINDNDEDIVSKLMNGQFTIEQAFKALEKRRRSESQEEKEIKKAQKVYQDDPESSMDEIAESGETGDSDMELSDEEIKQLSFNATDLKDIDGDSLEEMVEEAGKIEGYGPHKQDPRYRERLDPALRKSVLARDNNTCQVCEVISGMEYVEVLDVHHIKEVYLGGDDSIENLITACTVCHKLVHLFGRGELQLKPIDEYDETERKKFARVVKLGNKIRADARAKGMKVDKLKKMDNTATIGRTKPGTGQVAG